MDTQKLCKTYYFNLMNAKFSFTPKHKFNFIFDKSAVGKSYLVKRMLSLPNIPDIQAVSGSNVNSFDFMKETNKLIIIDETALAYLQLKYDWTSIQKSPNVFVFIVRYIPTQLSVDYRAIYELQHKGGNYILVHKYPYLQELKSNPNYIVEDSKSGYQYFCSKLPNVKSAYGKDNIPNLDLENTTIIADGSAFARIIEVLVSNGFDISNLFLPESFEGLLISYNTSNLAKRIYERAYSDAVLDYKSIEEYFESTIKLIYKDYKKHTLPKYMYDFDLLNINHCNLTNTILRHYDVNKFNYKECEELFNKLSKHS